jgi:uncharacterized protein YaeQ
MAAKSKVFKVNLQIADMDRHYYNNHLLTIAQHPSETDERMMVRLLAFALNASDNLGFADGINDQNQADLWKKDFSGQVSCWINVGLPSEKLIAKAVSRAEQVIIYSYGGPAADIWWKKLKVANYKNLNVINLADTETKELALMYSRGMKINFTIQEGEVLITNETATLNLTPLVLK